MLVLDIVQKFSIYRNIEVSIIVSKFSIYRNIEVSIYRIERVFALHPLASPRNFVHIINECFDVSNIHIVSIRVLVYRYRIDQFFSLSVSYREFFQFIGIVSSSFLFIGILSCFFFCLSVSYRTRFRYATDIQHYVVQINAERCIIDIYGNISTRSFEKAAIFEIPPQRVSTCVFLRVLRFSSQEALSYEFFETHSREGVNLASSKN